MSAIDEVSKAFIESMEARNAIARISRGGVPCLITPKFDEHSQAKFEITVTMPDDKAKELEALASRSNLKVNIREPSK